MTRPPKPLEFASRKALVGWLMDGWSPIEGHQYGPGDYAFVLVRDGFHFWAFLCGALWMLVHRLWLVLVGYLVLVIAGGLLWRLFDLPAVAGAAAGLVLALLIGFEAASLRRWTLSRRGWTNLGVVVGEDRESAERRFFDAWVRNPVIAAAPQQSAAARHPATDVSDVIGLFPEPGGRT